MPAILTQNPELLVLALVLSLEWLMPIPPSLSPATGIRALANALAVKLVKNQSRQQLQLSGWLALVSYFALLLIILWSVLFITPNDAWIQGLLLYFSLGYQHTAGQMRSIQDAQSQQQKSVARSLLSKHSEFETHRLSPLGINKLSLEIITYKFVSEWIIPVVMFCLSGGIAALVYRALLEAHKAWMPQKNKYQYFGQGVTVVKNLIELLPTLFIAPVYSIFKSSPGWLTMTLAAKSAWRQSKTSNLNQLLWLSIVSAGCKSELAGPLMLEGRKLPRPRLNHGLPINEAAIGQLLAWNNRFRLTVIMFIMTIFVLLGLK